MENIKKVKNIKKYYFKLIRIDSKCREFNTMCEKYAKQLKLFITFNVESYL